jgi:hypothetical protein
MSHDKAIVRKQVERIDGVTKARVEWIYDEGELLKVLVVEVSFDMDITVGLPCLAKPLPVPDPEVTKPSADR